MRGIRQTLGQLGQLDRRWVFLGLALAVGVPLVLPVRFIALPSPETLRFVQALDEAIAKPEPLLVEVDFGPQTMAEMEPILLAVLHRIFKAQKKVVFLSFMPEAIAPLREHLAKMEQRYGLHYGEDYAFLGYGTSWFTAIYAMGTSMEAYFHTDDRQTPYAQVELLSKISKLSDFSAVVNIASNSLPQHWIKNAVGPFGVRLLVCITAVQATEYYPYLQTGQLAGLIAGGRAGAELEGLYVKRKVLESTGDATRGLGSQSLALLAIVVFIALGNIGYFANTRRNRGRSR